MIPVLVINPHDGQTYDLSSLFSYLEREKTTAHELSARCQTASDSIVQFYDASNTAYFREMQNTVFLMNSLRDVFAGISPVEML